MFAFSSAVKPLDAYDSSSPISEEFMKANNLSRIVRLSSNENPLGCSPAVNNALGATLGGHSVYPDGYCTNLRMALSTHYNVSPQGLVFGAGSDEVIAMLGKVFIEAGDEAITGAPSFSQYAASVEAMGGKMVYVPLHDHTFDLDALISAISPKTKLIFIANPNNPTGTYFSQKMQDDFMAKVPETVVVVFDEAYQEYVEASDYPNTWETLLQYPNAVLLKTFSKIYGLASFRIGFGVAHPAIVEHIEKIRCPFNVSSQAQIAAIAALSDQDFVRASHEENRRIMTIFSAAMSSMAVEVIPSQANFVMLDMKRDSRVICEKLMSYGYVLRAGSAFGMDNFIRTTIGSAEDMVGLMTLLAMVSNDY